MAGVLADAAAAPDLDDARRAAKALAEVGVARVLLHGSVARGDQSRHSDIDLIAVYDHLDYTQRFARRGELERLARDASGHPVDVHVTDCSEWAIRTRDVPCSFEARVAPAAVELHNSGHNTAIDWDKEIGLPATPVEELAVRFQNMAAALSRLAGALVVSRDEIDASAEGDHGGVAFYEDRRFADACAQAHLVLECSAKALWVHANAQAPPKAHDLAKLTAGLAASTLQRWHRLTEGIDPDLHLWRQGGTYAEDRPVMRFDESYLRRHADMAADIAAWVIEACEEAGVDAVLMRRGRRDLHHVQEALANPIRLASAS